MPESNLNWIKRNFPLQWTRARARTLGLFSRTLNFQCGWMELNGTHLNHTAHCQNPPNQASVWLSLCDSRTSLLLLRLIIHLFFRLSVCIWLNRLFMFVGLRMKATGARVPTLSTISNSFTNKSTEDIQSEFLLTMISYRPCTRFFFSSDKNRFNYDVINLIRIHSTQTLFQWLGASWIEHIRLYAINLWIK